MSKKTPVTALYPGTFDGVTLGHMDIARRGAGLFDKLFIGVSNNVNKRPLFTVEERIEMLSAETGDLDNVVVESFEGLTMDYAERIGADFIIRGLRVVSDFEYEFQMALMNRQLNPRVETLLMFPAADQLFVSSSLIKEVLQLGGDVTKFVPPTTERFLRSRLGLPAKAR